MLAQLTTTYERSLVIDFTTSISKDPMTAVVISIFKNYFKLSNTLNPYKWLFTDSCAIWGQLHGKP